jgi:hypothetical protein
MKIIIAGGRDVTEYHIMLDAIVKSGFWKLHKNNIEVVSGMARGADTLGVEFAKRNGLVLHEFHADWEGIGRSAGHRRNAQMGQFAKAHNGKLLALWDGVSPGTAGMLAWARQHCLEHYIYRTD